MERQAKDGTIYQMVGKDEWAPVTRTAKDGTVYKKVGEDQWAASEAAKPKEKSFLDNFTGENGKQLARTTINEGLPIVGALSAGLLATPESAGLATIPAGAAGYAAGKQAARVINNKLFGDDIGAQDLVGLAKQTGKDFTTGAVFETGGRLIGEIPALIKAGGNSIKNKVAQKVGANVEFTPVANREAIEAAAQKIGVKTPKALLTDNPNYQNLESGLSQSGSLPAKETRDTYDQFFKGMDKASSKISDLKSPDSDFAIGKSIQDDISNQVSKSREPVSDLYKSITPELQKIPVNEKVVNRVFGDLKRNPMFQTKDGAAFLEEHKNLVLQSPELNSLKELRSSYADMVSPNAAPIEAKRVEALRNAVTSVRDNSIESMKSDLPKHMHGQVDDLIQKISLADSAHASNLKDINEIKGIVGNKDFNSPTGFLNKISEAKESDLAQRASNLDVSTFKGLKEKYPSVFEKAKTAKVNDMVQRASHPVNGFNDTSFLKQYDSLDREMRDVLFSKDIQEHIEALRTVRQATPDRLGPSGTPKGLMTMDAFSPKRNVTDYVIKKSLDSVSKDAEPVSKEIIGGLAKPSKVTPLLQLIKGSGPAEKSMPINLPRSADKQDEASAPLKGPEKWANDGAAKLKTHGLDDQSVIDEMMKSQKGRDLLIKASDLKPGSKAMDQIFSQIKSQYKGGV